MSLWEWTLAAYTRPGAREACLELQDDHGQNVCLLLWAAWARTVDPTLLGRAAALARSWDATATSQLRQVRRALKAPVAGVDVAARENLLREVKAAELLAERTLIEALESIVPAQAGASPARALAAGCAAWGGEVPEDAIGRLAAALDLGLLPTRDLSQDASELQKSFALMDDEVEWERGLRARLAAVIQEHADTDAAIQALSLSPLPDIQVVGRLKRRKLSLKDEIARIQDQLTPDIIA